MQTLTINIKRRKIAEKITEFLKQWEDDEVEIVSQEDIEDLKLLAATRGEETIPFSEYLKNAD